MKKIIALSALAALMVVFCAGAALADTQYATVVTPTSDGTVYVRTVAGEGRPIAGVAKNGDTLVILKKGNTWHRVKVVRTGLTGYMYGEYIRFTSSSGGDWSTDSAGGDWSWGGASSGGVPSGGVSSGYTPDASMSDNDTLLNRFGTVSSSDGFANLRWGPSTTEFGVIVQLNNGTKIWALEQNGSWYRCVTQSGKVGYVHQTLIKLGETSTGAVGKAARVRSSEGTANLRTGAGTDYSVVKALNVGAMVSVLDVSGNWYRVKVNGENTTGYMHRSLLRFMWSASTTGNVNLRRGPSVSYGIKRVLNTGTPITLLATDGSFCRVDTGKDIAYISKKYVSI